jgi:hypothetical protein
MTDNKQWTPTDVNNFASYISKLGGTVVKVYELREGYQFDIQPPPNAEPKWGQLRLTEFDKQR